MLLSESPFDPVVMVPDENGLVMHVVCVFQLPGNLVVVVLD
jgi:hypothetical protein